MTNKSDGGPSKYYDFAESYKTVNDILEEKGAEQWKEHSWHLSNIFKAVWRWGIKDGTTAEYDAKKIIYSACRILKRMKGVDEVRSYLTGLLNDAQFSEGHDIVGAESSAESPAESQSTGSISYYYQKHKTEVLYNLKNLGMHTIYINSYSMIRFQLVQDETTFERLVRIRATLIEDGSPINSMYIQYPSPTT